VDGYAIVMLGEFMTREPSVVLPAVIGCILKLAIIMLMILIIMKIFEDLLG
jgi:hypothetical protein